MTSMPGEARIPPDSADDADNTDDTTDPKQSLIIQIMELQNRYCFIGPQHTEESLADRPMKWLEKLCDMQLLCITLFHLQDRNMQSRTSRDEYERARMRMNDQTRSRAGARPGGYVYDEYADWSAELPARRQAPLGMDGACSDVRPLRRRLA